jgi:hypothetical protein
VRDNRALKLLADLLQNVIFSAGSVVRELPLRGGVDKDGDGLRRRSARADPAPPTARRRASRRPGSFSWWTPFALRPAADAAPGSCATTPSSESSESGRGAPGARADQHSLRLALLTRPEEHHLTRSLSDANGFRGLCAIAEHEPDAQAAALVQRDPGEVAAARPVGDHERPPATAVQTREDPHRPLVAAFPARFRGRRQRRMVTEPSCGCACGCYQRRRG